MIVAEKWRPMAKNPTDEDELRSFVAEKLGDLQGQFSKLIATLNLIAPGETDQQARAEQADQSMRIRRLLYILIVLVSLLYILFGLHVAWTAGWLGV